MAYIEILQVQYSKCILWAPFLSFTIVCYCFVFISVHQDKKDTNTKEKKL